MRSFAFLILLSLPAAAGEKAAYDSNGRIIALLSEAEDVEVASNVVAVLPTGKRVPLQVRGGDRRGLMRQGRELAWSGVFTLPDGGRGRLELKSEENESGLRYTGKITAETALELNGVELDLDLPRPVFLNGRVTPAGGEAIPLASVRGSTPALYRGETEALQFRDAAGHVTLDVGLGGARAASVVDRWDPRGRSWQVRVPLGRGAFAAGASAELTASLHLVNQTPAAPVRVTLNTAKTRYRFDGFGGNYCWSNQSPISDYTMKNLKIAWARTEMKVMQWDKQRDNPGPELRADFERMRELQKLGAHHVISIWWLPERFYTDAYEKPRMAHFRLIKPEKWDELLDLLGSYLLYAKLEYGVEPDLFSFNEANIGVYVGLTPETHTEAIKRIGAYFRQKGLKTRMLLGDATGPRDTHQFVLEAAADPEALQFVGAVAFHSWGGGTPEQYEAWGDVAEWLKLPLLVSELGVDAAAYYTRSWDSYQYGLREARMTQELLTYARPQGTQFWQFTNDYALARMGPNGAVEPTARFWLMKQFTDLTPHGSEALAASSDQPSVLVTGFRKGGAYTLHVLNLGAGREASFAGLPEGDWRITQSTEAAQYQSRPAGRSNGGALQVALPGRSLVTLTAQ